MITLSKFKEASIEAGKRFLKVLQFGAKTAKESYPFGFDSAPLEDYTAIYADTSNKGESVIIGYINRNQVAKLGEARMYALGSSGELLGYVYARDNGVTEINGGEFSAVRFQNLKNAIYDKDQDINIELQKIAVAIVSLGGSYTPGSIFTNLDSSESSTVKIK